MEIIEVSHLSKSFDRNGEPFWALDDVSFKIGEGEIVGIIGRNGAGKSTLLKVLGRITRPTRGRAVMRGQVAALLEVGTGFHPDLSGRENVFMNGAILGMSRREIRKKFDAIVDFAEIGTSIDVPVKRYSSGMYVRLAFSVAAHLDPQILLVDEVLAVGDYAFQAKCLERTQAVAGEGRTVLFVSHNIGAIHRLCRRTIYLEEGRLQCFDETSVAVDAYLSQGCRAGSVYRDTREAVSAVQLKSITLEGPNDKPTSFVTYHDPFRFRLEYDVNEAVSGVSIGVGLGTIEYLPLFTTADYDTVPSRLGRRDTGRYQACVEIPGGWLNTGKYIVQVYIANASTRTVYDRVEAFTFDVVDSGSPASYHGVNFRRGVLQPLLNWKVERLEQGV